MTEDDLDAVLAIESVSVPVPWSRASYENEMALREMQDKERYYENR